MGGRNNVPSHWREIFEGGIHNAVVSEDDGDEVGDRYGTWYNMGYQIMVKRLNRSRNFPWLERGDMQCNEGLYDVEDKK